MILAVDVGNTNIVLGVLDGEKLVCSGALSANVYETEIEYSIKLKSFLDIKGVEKIDGAIVSSVVPALVRTLKKALCLFAVLNLLLWAPG